MNRITSSFLSWSIRTIIKIGGYTDMLDKVRIALQGKKTYLVAVGMIIAACIEFAGTGDTGKLVNSIIEAMAFMTVRAGVAKAEVK